MIDHDRAAYMQQNAVIGYIARNVLIPGCNFFHRAQMRKISGIGENDMDCPWVKRWHFRNSLPEMSLLDQNYLSSKITTIICKALPRMNITSQIEDRIGIFLHFRYQKERINKYKFVAYKWKEDNRIKIHFAERVCEYGAIQMFNVCFEVTFVSRINCSQCHLPEALNRNGTTEHLAELVNILYPQSNRTNYILSAHNDAVLVNLRMVSLNNSDVSFKAVAKSMGNRKIGCLQKLHFACLDGHCISEWFVLDGEIDCPDGSDEAVNNLPCIENSEVGYVQCKTDYFKCSNLQSLPWYSVCDGQQDCTDGGDETMCLEIQRGSHIENQVFICPHSNREILYQFLNDLVPDCESAEDEAIMQRLTNDSSLADVEFNIEHGNLPCVIYHPKSFASHGLCLYDMELSGHLRFCRNGAHLANCEKIGCPTHFKCPASYCVPARRICDGVSDCPYGDDEHGCSNQHLSCPGYFKCKSGACLDMTEVCNGHADCAGGEDEMFCYTAKCPEYCQCKTVSMSCVTYSLDRPSKLNITGYKAVHVSGHSSLPIHNDDKDTVILLLALSNTTFISITAHSFSVMPLLFELHLSMNKLLFEVMENSFADLYNLRRLYLNGNTKLRMLGNKSFNGLSLLEHIDLSHTGLEKLNENIFGNLKVLKLVILSHSRLVSFDTSVVGSVKAMHLDLRKTKYLINVIIGNNVSSDITILSDSAAFCCLLRYHLLCQSPQKLHWCGNDSSVTEAGVALLQAVLLFLLSIISIVFIKRSNIKCKLFLQMLIIANILNITMSLYVAMTASKDVLFGLYTIFEMYSAKYWWCTAAASLQIFSFLGKCISAPSIGFSLHRGITNRHLPATYRRLMILLIFICTFLISGVIAILYNLFDTPMFSDSCSFMTIHNKSSLSLLMGLGLFRDLCLGTTFMVYAYINKSVKASVQAVADAGGRISAKPKQPGIGKFFSMSCLHVLPTIIILILLIINSTDMEIQGAVDVALSILLLPLLCLMNPLYYIGHKLKAMIKRT